MPQVPSGQEVYASWLKGIQRSTDKAKARVSAVTENPTAKAAAKVDQWAAGVQRAKEDGSFVKGCMRSSLADWQRQMTEKGIPNMAKGAQLAESKVVAFHNWLQPITASNKAEIARMDSGTPEASKARMDRNFELMVGRKYKTR